LAEAGRDEADVQPEQGEEDAVTKGRLVAGRLVGPGLARVAGRYEGQETEKGRVGGGVDQEEGRERARAGRGGDQAGKPAADSEAEVCADALQRIARVTALVRRDRCQERVVARPEDSVSEPDERSERERVPRLPHQREEREGDGEHGQGGRERPFRPEPV